jgi:mercuric ion binding protein
MRTAKIFIAVVLMMTVSAIAFSQTTTQKSGGTKTETFKVWGKCDMCKARIEKTVKAEGVTSANWDTKTSMLTVSYDPSKTNQDVLSKKLAAVGHDTEKYKAPDDAYAKLPGCCQYERSK